MTLILDLSQPSVIDLTGSLTSDCEAFFGSCGFPPEFGNAVGSFELSGPGVDITQTSGTFTLGPGEYVLTASSMASASTDILVFAFSDLTLDAEFRDFGTPLAGCPSHLVVASLASRLLPLNWLVSNRRSECHPTTHRCATFAVHRLSRDSQRRQVSSSAVTGPVAEPRR